MRILCCVLLVLLTGCSDNYRMEKVTETFPDSEVAFTPTKASDFIVRKPDGSIWYVRCDNPVSGNVTSKSQLFGPKK